MRRTPPHSIVSKAGRLVVGRRQGQLVLDWAVPGVESTTAPSAPAADKEAAALIAALTRWLKGNARALDGIPTGKGTEFQRAVWNACRTIPRGETRTYGWIAQRLGKSGHAARAVGQALRKNPLSIVVPCHRVVGASGLGGYSGATAGPLAQVKERLLALELELEEKSARGRGKVSSTVRTKRPEATPPTRRRGNTMARAC